MSVVAMISFRRLKMVVIKNGQDRVRSLEQMVEDTYS